MKQNLKKNKFITVVTVVYNSDELIEQTIGSVLEQTYKYIEYIIIDGESSDKTLSIINRYKDEIDIIVSEPDKGVYDAMNKAIGLCSGEYINFLNAGDTYISPGILSNVVKSIENNNKPALLYGYASMVYNGKKLLIGKPDIQKMKICHQAAFYKSNLHYTYGLYDLHYEIIADREFFTKVYLGGENIKFINEVYINYLYDGITHRYPFKRIKEELSMENIHYKNRYIINVTKYIIKSLYFLIKNGIR